MTLATLCPLQLGRHWQLWSSLCSSPTSLGEARADRRDTSPSRSYVSYTLLFVWLAFTFFALDWRCLYSAPSLSIGTQAFCAPVGGAQHPDRVLLPSPPAVCGDTYWLHVCSFAIKPCGSFQNVRVFPLVLQTLYIWGRSAITVGFNV